MPLFLDCRLRGSYCSVREGVVCLGGHLDCECEKGKEEDEGMMHLEFGDWEKYKFRIVMKVVLKDWMWSAQLMEENEAETNVRIEPVMIEKGSRGDYSSLSSSRIRIYRTHKIVYFISSQIFSLSAHSIMSCTSASCQENWALFQPQQEQEYHCPTKT